MLIISNGVTAMAAGDQHSLILKSDGSLWGMGSNGYGELGDGTRTNRFLPEQIVSNGVVAVAAGARHSLFVKSDGSLWAMGLNASGQLGDGTQRNAYAPLKIVPNGVIAVSGGCAHTLFIKADGTLWGMGDNNYSELTGRSTSSAVPIQLTGAPGGLWVQGTCLVGGPYSVLASTNLTLPLDQWTPVHTNSATVRGTNNFSAFTPDIQSLDGDQWFFRMRAESDR
jgi:alpha-tubulin suppressor-like RCC1 family protein